MTLDVEGGIYGGGNREQSLRRSWRFEALLPPFSLSNRQMRILRPIGIVTLSGVANSEQPKVRVPRDKKSRQEGDVYAKQATPDQLCEARQHPR